MESSTRRTRSSACCSRAPCSVFISVVGAGATASSIETLGRDDISIATRYGATTALYRGMQLMAIIFAVTMNFCAYKSDAIIYPLVFMPLYTYVLAEAGSRTKREDRSVFSVECCDKCCCRKPGDLERDDRILDCSKGVALGFCQKGESVRGLLGSGVAMAVLTGLALNTFYNGSLHWPNNYADETLPAWGLDGVMGGPAVANYSCSKAHCCWDMDKEGSQWGYYVEVGDLTCTSGEDCCGSCTARCTADDNCGAVECGEPGSTFDYCAWWGMEDDTDTYCELQDAGSRAPDEQAWTCRQNHNSTLNGYLNCFERTSGTYPAWGAYILSILLLPLSASLDPKYGLERMRGPTRKQRLEKAERKMRLRGSDDHDILEAKIGAVFKWADTIDDGILGPEEISRVERKLDRGASRSPPLLDLKRYRSWQGLLGLPACAVEFGKTELTVDGRPAVLLESPGLPDKNNDVKVKYMDSDEESGFIKADQIIVQSSGETLDATLAAVFETPVSVGDRRGVLHRPWRADSDSHNITVRWAADTNTVSLAEEGPLGISTGRNESFENAEDARGQYSTTVTGFPPMVAVGETLVAVGKKQGTLQMIPDNDTDIKVRWTANSEESGYIKASKVTVVETGLPLMTALMGQAERSGLIKVGDLIVSVNGDDLAGMDADAVVACIKDQTARPLVLGMMAPATSRVATEAVEVAPAHWSGWADVFTTPEQVVKWTSTSSAAVTKHCHR